MLHKRQIKTQREAAREALPLQRPQCPESRA
jgi:hypothetical protein